MAETNKGYLNATIRKVTIPVVTKVIRCGEVNQPYDIALVVNDNQSGADTSNVELV